MNPNPPSITTASSLIWGSPEWIVAASSMMAVVLILLAWTYDRARAGRPVKILAAALKAVGFAVLIFSLIEPLLTGSRPKPGANAFVVLVDNSQSLQVRDAGATRTRADWVRDHVRDGLSWRTRLAQDFDVRPYLFDSHLRGVESLDAIPFDGTGSALGSSLSAIGRRFRGLPLAGVIVVSDGNRTDPGEWNLDLAGLPPVYPVVPPSRGTGRDIGVRDVSVSQANFEAAPVVLRAEVSATGFRDQPIRVVVLDEADHEVARQEATPTTSDGAKPLAFRFQFRPDHKGVQFYRVVASSVESASASATANLAPAQAPPAPETSSDEQTLANNSRLVVVDQGEGPYRVLYVSGRPSWEFKFLRRAILGDDQVQLVGLLRIARRQPKFDFQASGNRTTSPLFNGFDNADPETTEAADQPVLVRLGTVDETELRDGFPKTAEGLFPYHAVILDDIEASFFTPDQMTILRNFVSQRGGGLLMLGGPDSFAAGKYDRTPVGDLWRWGLKRANPAETDLDRSWRQTVRWLVADVPRRVDVALKAKPDAAAPTVELIVRVRDPQYRPLDDAKVSVDVTMPGGDHIAVGAEPLADEPGAYLASVVTRQPGPYRFKTSATAADGATVGTQDAGWAAQPSADEFARLEPNRDAMAAIAAQTHGEVVDGDRLDSFVTGLSSRSAPIVEPWTAPLWHQPFYFLVAIICLAAEWGIRRINGLA